MYVYVCIQMRCLINGREVWRDAPQDTISIAIATVSTTGNYPWTKHLLLERTELSQWQFIHASKHGVAHLSVHALTITINDANRGSASADNDTSLPRGCGENTAEGLHILQQALLQNTDRHTQHCVPRAKGQELLSDGYKIISIYIAEKVIRLPWQPLWHKYNSR